MAFNNFPYTNFQDLNLGWILGKLGVVEKLAIDSAASVSQYDARITANTNAIEQLGINLGAISDVARVFVNNSLEAYYKGAHITGSELVSVLRSHGTLPYVEYNGEIYMLDTVSNAGDLRFSMCHTVTGMDDLVVRHIMIPAQSYNVAYSITNVSAGGGSSGNVFAVVVREQSGRYVADHTYSEIISQMQNGRIPVLLVSQGNNTHYSVCGMAGTDSRTINGQSVPCIRFAAPGWLYSSSNNVGVWTIDANGVEYMASLKQMATLDNIIQMVNDGVTTNALLKTAQTLSVTEQAQVKQNIGISDSGGGGMTEEIKQALLDCFENVAWINGDGQTYYNALYAALYHSSDLVSISAVFTQGDAVIYDTDSLDTLKQYLTVTAHYDNGTTQTVTNYTLSGSLVRGTSTITASFSDKTATFTVTVSSENAFVGKKLTYDGNTYACFCVDTDTDMVNGATVAVEFTGSNAVGGSNTSSTSSCFGADSVEPGAAFEQVSAAFNTTFAIDSGNVTGSAQYKLNRAPTKPIGKFPVRLSGSGSFTIDSLSVKVNGVSKQVIAITSFFASGSDSGQITITDA